jgi:hypothetical protein
MANRSAKFASAIIASLLAGAPTTIVCSSFAHAAHGCQTKPGSETRQGQQWRYRTEHGTKRRCWFLIAMNGSIADAHDELPLPTVPPSPVAPRWPETFAVNSSVNPAPEASTTIVADANPTPQADPSPALAPVTLAEPPALTQKTVTLQLFLLLILGMLALASLTEEFIEEFLFRLSKQRRSDVLLR